MQELVAAHPELAAKVALVEKRAAEKAAMTAVEKRLACEKLLLPASKHESGVYDDAMRLAVRRFQQKHMIYEANFLRRKTVDALARPLLDNDYDGLVRALRERVVSAAGIIEDGTAGTQKSPARNLVEEYTQYRRAAARAHRCQSRAGILQAPPGRGLSYAARGGQAAAAARVLCAAHGSLHRRRPRRRLVRPAVRPRRALQAARAQALPEPDAVRDATNGKRIPLARWRTTIGGWRAEQATDGYEYFRYKGSDVGPRVIRQVVSGPVWIAPESTPIRSLVKGKTVNGRSTKIVNYDELGPGYLSAYGLVAGYFVEPGVNGRPDWDNGVRAHGSSDYLSIYSAERLLARLPPPAQPHRDSALLVHLEASQQDRGRRSAAELQPAVPAEGDGLRDADSLARLHVLCSIRRCP